MTIKTKLNLQAIIASFFSVLFSISFVNQINTGTTNKVVLFVFLVLFSVYNEDRKVKEFRLLFQNRKYSKFIIAFTLTISILMSSVGAYFWAAGDVNIESKISAVDMNQEFKIRQKYALKIDSIQAVKTSTEINQQTEQIKFWKSKRALNKEERSEFTKNVKEGESKLSQMYLLLGEDKRIAEARLNDLMDFEIKNLNTDSASKKSVRNFENWLAITFMILIFITEFVIINIQKETANYLRAENSVEICIIKDLIFQGKTQISAADIKFHPFSSQLTVHPIQLFNMLKNLGVFSSVESKKKLINSKVYTEETGEFKMPQKTISIVIDYFRNFEELKSTISDKRT